MPTLKKKEESFGLHALLASNTVMNEYYPTLAAQLFELTVETGKWNLS